MSKIYFMSVRVNKTVHMQALGFTNDLYVYAWAANEEEATRIVHAYCHSHDLKAVRVSGRVALQQELETYTFPEQVYGIPFEMAAAVINKRAYGSPIQDASLLTLRKNVERIAQALAHLAAQAEEQIPG